MLIGKSRSHRHAMEHRNWNQNQDLQWPWSRCPRNISVNTIKSTVNTYVLTLLTIYCVSTSDNSRFASCGNDRSVLCWDVSTGSVIRRYAGHYEVSEDIPWFWPLLAEELTLCSLLIVWISTMTELSLQVVRIIRTRTWNSWLTEPNHSISTTGSFDTTVRLWDCR